MTFATSANRYTGISKGNIFNEARFFVDARVITNKQQQTTITKFV